MSKSWKKSLERQRKNTDPCFPAFLLVLRPSTRPDMLPPVLNPVFKARSLSMAELVTALLLSCTVYNCC